MNLQNKKSFLFFGGGSGLSNILKPFVNSFKNDEEYDLSAIVSTFDNGGSTGIIRSNKKIPALGDLRKVISSLSSESNSLFLEYRFSNRLLFPHTVGNIILENFLNKRKSLFDAVKEVSSIYIEHEANIFPASEIYANLVAVINKKNIYGEENIGDFENKILEDLYLKAIDEKKILNPISNFSIIKNTDYIFFAPGSFYTSLLASILPHKSTDAIKLSKSKKIMFQNLEDTNFIGKLKFFYHKTDGILPDYIVSSDDKFELKLKKTFPEIVFLYHDFIGKNKMIHDYEKTKNFFEKKYFF
ncbi:MAG: hypothetical protein CL773_03150 [Chloroflexi bacterium]|nr:hypothetical protein [Chloroflexota bacterium]|tara:strand:+ start:3096 stop:3995 length:900 start_codon:yes stop_codon:yes gene_type:complete